MLPCSHPSESVPPLCICLRLLRSYGNCFFEELWISKYTANGCIITYLVKDVKGTYIEKIINIKYNCNIQNEGIYDNNLFLNNIVKYYLCVCVCVCVCVAEIILIILMIYMYFTLIFYTKFFIPNTITKNSSMLHHMSLYYNSIFSWAVTLLRISSNTIDVSSDITEY